jgi:hypothetical protein
LLDAVASRSQTMSPPAREPRSTPAAFAIQPAAKPSRVSMLSFVTRAT